MTDGSEPPLAACVASTMALDVSGIRWNRIRRRANEGQDGLPKGRSAQWGSRGQPFPSPFSVTRLAASLPIVLRRTTLESARTDGLV